MPDPKCRDRVGARYCLFVEIRCVRRNDAEYEAAARVEHLPVAAALAFAQSRRALLFQRSCLAESALPPVAAAQNAMLASNMEAEGR